MAWSAPWNVEESILKSTAGLGTVVRSVYGGRLRTTIDSRKLKKMAQGTLTNTYN